jgi:hypothetical protein
MLYKLTKERYYDVAEYRGLYSQTSGSGSASGESSNKSGNGSGTGSGNAGGSRTGSWRERLSKQNGGENGDEEAEKDVLNGNVLMVDQLWIWTISTRELTFDLFHIQWLISC